MRPSFAFQIAAVAVLAASALPACATPPTAYKVPSVQLGPRPFFLVNDMPEGKLKRQLNACAKKTEVYHVSEFSIAHRGAPLQFPEHTLEAYEAGAHERRERQRHESGSEDRDHDGDGELAEDAPDEPGHEDERYEDRRQGDGH